MDLFVFFCMEALKLQQVQISERKRK